MPAGEQSERGRNVKQKECQSHRRSLAERHERALRLLQAPTWPCPCHTCSALQPGPGSSWAGLSRPAGKQASQVPQARQPRRTCGSAPAAWRGQPSSSAPGAGSCFARGRQPKSRLQTPRRGGTALRRCIMHVARLRSCPAWRRPTQQAGACQEGRSRACSF